MDEFKKPYEYFEEKGVGGILLVLFFMLISVEPFMGILSIALGNNAFPNFKIFLPVFVTLSVVYIIYSLLSGIFLKKLYSFAIASLKVFLVYRLIYLVPVLIISMRYQIDTIPYAKTYGQYQVAYNSIISSFWISILYAFIFSIGWYIYLVKSKKVQELFPKKRTGQQVNHSVG